MIIINKQFLISFIVFLNIFTFSFFSYTSVQASTADVSLSVGAIAGTTCAVAPQLIPVVCGAVIVCSIGYISYSAYNNYFKPWVSSRVSSWSNAQASSYVNIYQNSKTKEYSASLTESGTKWLSSELNILEKSDTVDIPRKYLNTNPSDVSEFVDSEGYFISKYSSIEVRDKKILQTFNVKAGDTINFKFTLNGETKYVQNILPFKYDSVIRTFVNTSGNINIGSEYFSEGSIYWEKVNSINSSNYVSVPFAVDGSGVADVSVGYTKGESICVPTTKVLDGLSIDSSKVLDIGSTVAVPVQSVSADGVLSFDSSISFDDISSNTISLDSDWVDVLDNDIDIDTDIDTDSTIGKVGSWVLNIPILGTILRAILSIYDLLKSFISTLINALKDLLISLFVPREGFLTDILEGFRLKLSTIFPCDLNSIQNLKNISSNEPNFIYTFSIMGKTVSLDLNIIKKAVPMTRTIFAGIVGIFLCWFHYRKIIQLVRGVSPISGGGNSREGGNVK